MLASVGVGFLFGVFLGYGSSSKLGPVGIKLAVPERRKSPNLRKSPKQWKRKRRQLVKRQLWKAPNVSHGLWDMIRIGPQKLAFLDKCSTSATRIVKPLRRERRLGTPAFYSIWMRNILTFLRQTRGTDYFLDIGEIGALHEKAPLPPDVVGTRTFIDGLSLEDLHQMYPNFNLSVIQPPDIVDKAETLSKVPSEYFDVFIGTHVLEHTADVLGTLRTWMRVLRPGGFLVLAVPSMCGTFDKQRLLTSWEHFASESRNPAQCDANKAEHFREWAISYWTSRNEGLPSAEVINYGREVSSQQLFHSLPHLYPAFCPSSPSKRATLLGLSIADSPLRLGRCADLDDLAACVQGE